MAYQPPFNFPITSSKPEFNFPPTASSVLSSVWRNRYFDLLFAFLTGDFPPLNTIYQKALEITSATLVYLPCVDDTPLGVVDLPFFRELNSPATPRRRPSTLLTQSKSGNLPEGSPLYLTSLHNLILSLQKLSHSPHHRSFESFSL